MYPFRRHRRVPWPWAACRTSNYSSSSARVPSVHRPAQPQLSQHNTTTTTPNTQHPAPNTQHHPPPTTNTHGHPHHPPHTHHTHHHTPLRCRLPGAPRRGQEGVRHQEGIGNYVGTKAAQRPAGSPCGGSFERQPPEAALGLAGVSAYLRTISRLGLADTPFVASAHTSTRGA